MYIDLLTKIKNAEVIGKKSIKAKFTKMDKAVIDVLQRAGFIKSVDIKGRAAKRVMDIELAEARSIEGVRFLSRPSLRKYSNYSKLKKVKGGHGLVVLTTPQGILSGFEARKKKVGGQLLFEIW